MTEPLSIPLRFNGPPGSGNGGYCCGRFAALVETPGAEVTLRAPPPLDTPLDVARADGGVEVRHGDTLVAQVRPGAPVAVAPAAPSFAEATIAAADYVGFAHHIFPGCFVCGPERAEGDGLRLFPGAVDDRDLVAAPWTPDASLADDDGRVRPEFLWAALDCPSYFALPRAGHMTALLARLTARIDDRPKAGERCVVAAWAISADGRKHNAATALYGEDGRLLAVADALWVEVRGGAGKQPFNLSVFSLC